MSVIVKVAATIQWQVGQIGSNDTWMGVCDPLNLAMEASSQDELHGVIEETMQLVLSGLLRDNELEGFLREHGWTASNLDAAGPADDVEFDIPWTAVVQGRARDLARCSTQ